MGARAMMGLARTGAAGTNGSGDYAIAFSTARSPSALVKNDDISPLFLATIEATEEAIYNSLFKATGVGDVRALPIPNFRDRLVVPGVIDGRPYTADRWRPDRPFPLTTMRSYYADHAQPLKRDLTREIAVYALRDLHQKRPLLHALVALANVAALAGSGLAILYLDRWYFWLPFAAMAGFAVFDFTVLLHEVVHRAVLSGSSERGDRFLGLLYAVPSGISASQFTRWHLDHHAGLGSDEEDPKRHYLSPKINARWLKILYFTPALFPIYFRAAAKEAATYEPELRRRIARERLATIAFQLSVLGAIAWMGGWFVAWKLYIVPIFFMFPIAFALNRLGQHYDIDPSDAAKWSTLMKGSWFWDAIFLFSNYHLEHHYFPGVPFYNLPRLQKVLLPFYEKRGMVARGYGELLWRYLILNRKPHTQWSAGFPSAALGSGQPAGPQESVPAGTGR